MSSSPNAARLSLSAAVRPRRWLLLATLSLVMVGGLPTPVAAKKDSWLSPTVPVLTVPPDSEAGRLITIAEQQIGARWQYAAIGPTRFDCSGLIFFAFREAGLADRIFGKRLGATAYMRKFAKLGLVSNSIADAQPGDVLIWGNGKHSGIYLGDNWAISTLVNPYGVRIHGVDRLNYRLTQVLRVQVSRESPQPPQAQEPPPAPELTPEPTPTT